MLISCDQWFTRVVVVLKMCRTACTGTVHVFANLSLSLSSEIARRFGKMTPEELAKKIGDRVARKNDDVRSHLEEMQRVNNEELRDLNR